MRDLPRVPSNSGARTAEDQYLRCGAAGDHAVAGRIRHSAKPSRHDRGAGIRSGSVQNEEQHDFRAQGISFQTDRLQSWDDQHLEDGSDKV